MTSPSSSRRDRLALVAIMTLAALVRLLYLLEYAASPFWDALIMDPGNHWEMARRLAAGEGMGPYALFRAPLYLYLLAGIRMLFGDGLWPARIFQLILGAMTAGLVFLLGRRFLAFIPAAIAGLLQAAFWAPVYFDGELLTESPATFLNVCLVLALVRADAERKRPLAWWALCGFIGGLSAVTRPNSLLAAAAVAAALVVEGLYRGRRRGDWRRLLRPAVFMLAALLPVAPVTIRNAVAARDFVLIASQGGINFWLGNHEGADGRTVVTPIPRREIPLSFLRSRADHPWLREDVWLSSAYGAERALRRRVRESEISDYWYGQAFGWMRAHPGPAAALMLKKALYLFQAREVSNNRDLAGHIRRFPVLRVLSLLGFGIVSPLMLAGIALAGRDWRRWRWPLLFFIVYAATVAMFFVTSRYRAPLLPVGMVFVGLWVEELARRWRERKSRALRLLLLTAVLAVPLNLDWPAWNDRPLRSAMRYNLGIALAEKGREAAAEAEFRAALAIKEQYPEAHFWLGRTLAASGRNEAAAAEMEKSLAQSPGYAPAHFELYRLYRRLGREDLARQHLSRARELAPGTFGP
jgi:tetratricopeptide (TPR) repeat protein